MAASLIRCRSALLQLKLDSSSSQRFTSRMDASLDCAAIAGCSALLGVKNALQRFAALLELLEEAEEMNRFVNLYWGLLS